MLTRLLPALALVCALFSAQPVLADSGWTYGVGAGLAALDIDGNGAFNSRARGDVEFELELDPDDVWEATESGVGFALMARREALTLSANFSRLKLQGRQQARERSGPLKADLEFESESVELTGEYVFSHSGNHTFAAIGGFRYTSQEYDATLKAGDQRLFKGSVEDDWTDALVGVSYTYSFSPVTSWRSKVTYGFGGSDGTAQFSTGIGRVFAQSWIVRLFVDIKDVEYEQGNRGSNDWFLYDASESTAGVSVMYLL